MSSGRLERDHAARCRVLGRADSETIGAPCVLAALGARAPEARQHHL